jgi:hypothetical protein
MLAWIENVDAIHSAPDDRGGGRHLSFGPIPTVAGSIDQNTPCFFATVQAQIRRRAKAMPSSTVFIAIDEGHCSCSVTNPKLHPIASTAS